MVVLLLYTALHPLLCFSTIHNTMVFLDILLRKSRFDWSHSVVDQNSIVCTVLSHNSIGYTDHIDSTDYLIVPAFVHVKLIFIIQLKVETKTRPSFGIILDDFVDQFDVIFFFFLGVVVTRISETKKCTKFWENEIENTDVEQDILFSSQ